MVFGGIAGLLAAVIYTIVTGKLMLTKRRIVYGLPARAAALLALVPMMLLVAYSVRVGGIVRLPGGIGIYLGTLGASVAIAFAVGWPYGEPPRQ